MNDQQICEFFDNHPNITLAQLAAITGKTIPELKRILMGEK